eukprot:symbB.v1.2.001957.t1/scaffold84.1/size341116/3
MARYDHQNLDLLAEFQEPRRRNTTVEVMAEAIHQRLVDGLVEHHKECRKAGQEGLEHLSRLEVLIKESDVAFAGFARPLNIE